MAVGLYRTSGFSSVNIPICANMQNTSLSADPYLSGVVQSTWNTDIALGKIGIRIPIESAFPLTGETIKIVYDSNVPPTSSTMVELGSFSTRTSGVISGDGEWQALDYTETMYEDQYEYFTEPNNIYAYSMGHTQMVDGTSLQLSGDYLTGWPQPVSGYDWYGSFDVRQFYDGPIYDPPLLAHTFIFGGSSGGATPSYALCERYFYSISTWVAYSESPANISWQATCSFYDGTHYQIYPYNTQVMYKYTESVDTWNTKTDPSVAYRYDTIAFPLNNKIYWGYGYWAGSYSDFYAYTVSVDTWAGSTAHTAGYFGTGYGSHNGNGYHNGEDQIDTWRFTAGVDTWVALSNIPTTPAIDGHEGCTNSAIIDDTIYEVCMHTSNTSNTRHRIYDILTDTWSEGTALPTSTWKTTTVPSDVGTLLVCGGGYAGVPVNALTQEYLPVSSTWTTQTNISVARGTMGASNYNVGGN